MAPPRKAGRSAPMGARTADVRRAERGRTGVETTPVYIRGAIDGDGTLDRDFIRKRLGEKLGKYASRIDRLDVALSRKAPARGAPDKHVTLEASVRKDGAIAVTGGGANIRAAFLDAIRALERSMRRSIERKRTTAARAQAKRN